jgi:hypothetical protein
VVRYKHSYHQKRLEEQAIKNAAGRVSERYAGVSCIEFQMTYYHRAIDPVLMERTLRFFPSSYARFHMRCPQFGCSGGGYDLTTVVDQLARSGRTAAKGTLLCRGSDGTEGHGRIAYAVTITYNGASRSRACRRPSDEQG